MQTRTVDSIRPSDCASQTFVSLLTARAPAAIAVIELHGPRSQELIGACWIAASPKRTREINSIRYGSWIGSNKNLGSNNLKKPTEDIVLCWKNNNSVEIHCHGGPVAASRIIADLLDLGATQASETNSAAITSRGMCSLAASQDLPFASTELTTAMLLDQERGVLDIAIKELRSLVKNGDLVRARVLHDDLVSRANFGTRLIRGWKVAIAGPPNAGKSSLLNRILGYSRAIVHAQPGTTRDVLYEQTNILGWPIMILDTAGLRNAECDIEAEGVLRAFNAFKNVDLILLTIEPNEGVTDLHRNLIATYPSKILGVITKSDLACIEEVTVDTRKQIDGSIELCSVSSKESLGLDLLFQAIIRKLYPNPAPPGTAIPFRESQLELIHSIMRNE